MKSFLLALLLLLFLIFLSMSAYSKDYALIISGAPNPPRPPDIDNEFMRTTLLSALALKNKNIETTVLMSGIDTNINKSLVQNTLFKNDYDYFLKKVPDAKSANKQNILKALNDIASNSKPGDTFKLNILGHGTLDCKNPNDKNDPDDLNKNCTHQFVIFDENGNVARFQTSEIISIISKMDKKGVLVDVNTNSCHSGILKNEFKDLTNTCVYLASTSNSVGAGCFESDPPPPESYDYTSSSEIMSYFLYKDILPSVEADDYLKKNKCLKKIKDHVKNNISFQKNETMKSLFQKIYEHDLTISQPSITSLFNYNLFTKDYRNLTFFTNDMSQKNKGPERLLLCSSNIENYFNELIDSAKEVSDMQIKLLHDVFLKSISKYNNNIEEQKKNIAILYNQESDIKLIPDAFNSMQQLQKDITSLTLEVIQNEKKLLSAIFLKENSTISKKDACDRKIN